MQSKEEVLEKLKNVMKKKEIIRGTIINVEGGTLQLVVDNNRKVRIKMHNDKSELYVPNKIKENGMNTTVKYLEGYVGYDIPFYIEKINNEEVFSTMEGIREQAINEIEKMELPCEIKVNILQTYPKYVIIEYKGLIQTVSEQALSTSEVGDVRAYVESADQEELRIFKLKGINTNTGAMVLDKHSVTNKTFKDKMAEGEYIVGDLCIGTIINKDIDGRLVMRLENGLIGVSFMPERGVFQIGNKVQALISGVDKKRPRLLLKRVKLIG